MEAVAETNTATVSRRWLPSTLVRIQIQDETADHRHRLRMDRPNDAVRCSRQEAVEQVAAFDRVGFRAASTIPFAPYPGESDRPSLMANHFGVLGAVVPVYS
jgi:hypothetical protein